MQILLLGGTGAMGVSLKSILAQRGDDIYITSRRSHKGEGNIHYLCGDAHDDSFMSEVLKDRYDAIVDFMIYGSGEFEYKAKRLLNATGQYIFTSSSRVYANSQTPITEETPRLLDVCKDADYLKTDEYALAKAREENVLFHSVQKNWTIIRPYITYNVERLQLGAIEKDIWLYRALHGRSIVLPKDVASHQTTMTYGGDVAAAIAGLIGNKKAYGEAFHLTGTEHMAWFKVLDIYMDVLEKECGTRLEIYMPENSLEISKIMTNTAQVVYDRLYDRVFDNSKLISVIGGISFAPMKEGLSQCLNEFMKNPRWRGNCNGKMEAYLTKMTGENISLSELGGKDKLKYLGWYYAPGAMKLLKNIKAK